MSEQKLESPVINGFGEVVYFSNAALQPNKEKEYKGVFCISSNPNPKQAHPTLCHAALLLNILEVSGVDRNNVKAAIVISGPGIDIASNNEDYLAKYGVDNPNLELEKQLKNKGVDLFVCAQSLVEFNLGEKDINEYTTFSLSALTDLLILQQNGYLTLP